jgi:hypothetical protein
LEHYETALEDRIPFHQKLICGLGGLFTLMPSMIADVVDMDELETRDRRGGQNSARTTPIRYSLLSEKG